MRISILCAGFSSPHAGWASIDELASLLAYYLDAELLSPAVAPDAWWRRWSGRQREVYHPIHAQGGDVLLVVARGPTDLGLLSAIPDVRRKYKKIYAWVTDSYFQAGFGRWTQLYDGITVTAHEDVDYVKGRFGIQVQHLYQGIDALTWAPRKQFARDIDLIGFGRTPPSYHECFSSLFHRADSPYLYLHSPLGHLHGSSVHQERGMLLKLLQRTRVSLAFHLYVEPQANRPRSMMVTSRWLESLAAGCIVAGKRPVSRMADDMLFWDGATVELDDEPQRAADQLQVLFAQNDALEPQRRSNIAHTLSRHDWRDRIHTLCLWFGLPISALLLTDLEQLQVLAKKYREQ